MCSVFVLLTGARILQAIHQSEDVLHHVHRSVSVLLSITFVLMHEFKDNSFVFT